MKSPLVTICIPNYNGGEYLKQCIDSALSQEYKNIEILISDNLSNDISRQVLELYKNEKSIKVIYQEKFLPMATHWNVFRNIINGELVFWLSADDLILPDCISKIVKMYNQEDNLKAIFFEYDYLDENNNISNKTPFFRDSALVDSKAYFKIFLKGNNFPLSSCVMTKKVFNKIGGFNEEYNFCSDWFMWLSITEKDREEKIGYIYEKLALYRTHSGSETNRNILNKNAIHEIKKMKDYFIKNNYLDDEIADMKKDADFGTAKIALVYAQMMKKNNNTELENYYIEEALKLSPKIENEKFYKNLKEITSEEHTDSFIKNPYDLPIGSLTVKL